MIVSAQNSLIDATHFISSAAAVLILLIVVLIKRNDFDPAVVYRLVFPVTVAGFVLLYFLISWDAVLTCTVMSIGYKLFDLVFWILIMKLAHDHKAYAYAIILFAICANYCGMGLGRLSASLLSGISQTTDTLLVAVLGGCLLLVFVITMVLPEQRVVSAWGRSGTEKQYPDAALQDTVDISVSILARDHHMTGRETEVMSLLAMGEESSGRIGRRDFLKGATFGTAVMAGTGALGTLTGCGPRTQSGSDEAAVSYFEQIPEKTEEGQTEELDCDILVVGMRGGCIMAYRSAMENLQALNGGKQVSVIAIDKAGKFGGKSALTHEILAVNPPLYKQIANGGADWVDGQQLYDLWTEHITREDGSVSGKPEVLKTFLDASGDTIDWLYGLGSNADMLEKYPAEQWAGYRKIVGTGQDDGKMLEAAIAIGAGTYNMDMMPMTTCAALSHHLAAFPIEEYDPDVKGLNGHTGRQSTYTLNDVPLGMGTDGGALFVTKNGKRFVNEADAFGWPTTAAEDSWKACVAGNYFYAIYSKTQVDLLKEEGFKHISRWESYHSQGGYPNEMPIAEIYDVIDAAVNDGLMWKADTLDDLASQIDMDAPTLKATVDTYNDYCEAGGHQRS